MSISWLLPMPLNKPARPVKARMAPATSLNTSGREMLSSALNDRALNFFNAVTVFVMLGYSSIAKNHLPHQEGAAIQGVLRPLNMVFLGMDERFRENPFLGQGFLICRELFP